MGVPNPVTNKLELHNTWLVRISDFFISCKAFADPLKADVLKNYIGWAVEQKFGVIDINIPKYLTGIDVSQAFLAWPRLVDQIAKSLSDL